MVMTPEFNKSKYTIWYYRIIENAKSKSRQKNGDVYFESHHINPKAMGGSDRKSNKVLLTFKEHYVVHLLLTKMVDDPTFKRKMHYAFYCLSWKTKNHNRKLNRVQMLKCMESNRIAASLRNQFGSNNHMFGLSAWNSGLTKQDPRVLKYVQCRKSSLRGRERWYYEMKTGDVTRSDAHPGEGWEIGRPNVRGYVSSMKGKRHTEEAKQKNRLMHIGKKMSACTKEKMRKIHVGRKNTEETKNIMSKAATGNYCYTNIYTRETKRFKSHPGEGWVRGTTKSKEFKEKTCRRHTETEI